MQTIECNETAFVIKINGQELTVDFSKMHPTWIDAHLRKAAQRFLNDKYSGEDAATKLELITADLRDIHSGEAMPEKERKAASAVKADPVRKLARETCTAQLVSKFKANAATFGADEKAWIAHPKIGKFFRQTPKGGVRFDLAAVDKYMAAEAARDGGTDYMADAKAAMDTASEAVDLSEFDF